MEQQQHCGVIGPAVATPPPLCCQCCRCRWLILSFYFLVSCFLSILPFFCSVFAFCWQSEQSESMHQSILYMFTPFALHLGLHTSQAQTSFEFRLPPAFRGFRHCATEFSPLFLPGFPFIFFFCWLKVRLTVLPP